MSAQVENTNHNGATSGVKNFLKSAFKKDSTEVCTETAPEVVQEHVRPVEHVETAEAVDRERHIHHHQHRIQPIVDKQELDAQHVHTTAPAVVREHKEEMLPEHQSKLHEQRTMHQNVQTTGEVERSAAHLGTHVNQHEHHHIHETIQPVIQRETIQPTHVHHTIPVSEKIHEAPIVHEATTLPAITLDQFSKHKDHHPESHQDSSHTHQFYEGSPRVGGQTETR
ncbi:hypothetical protein TREMEDRAFT_66871 [Tremella mesenterica DSM 1558]|uniref:uncharacterized protein n=1 Tax=Tremella mesenterica (strain ATCC 24925 / CBS 8224 / DSM 1558 / NBRC 9311 / NRRL Y-6157 / RJB 2259-6 / UBC 559-6) TaxID=578456 RepID=UPI0003F49090|nr:uncharacterized protein TREMEDRAFT_66871 [Tremella mesenterica DSM 1558]EIW72399.1 hypothetical protein TREMEDRAFT_66871 [Tremella mesenterica DSM 1558]